MSTELTEADRNEISAGEFTGLSQSLSTGLTQTGELPGCILSGPLSRVMEELGRREAISKTLTARSECPNPRCVRGELFVDGVRLSCPLFGSKFCDLHKRMVATGKRSLKDCLEQRGFPRRYLRMMSGHKPTDAVKTANHWGLRGNLIFSGAVGVGKSFAAVLAVCRWGGSRIERCLVRPDNNPDEIARVTASRCGWFRAASLLSVGDHAEAARAEAKRLSLVVIDDLGAESAGDWSLSMLSDVLSERYDNELQSIVTTNIPDGGKLASRYDSRIADRLLDDDGVYAVCGGPSMRGVGQDG